MVSWREEPIDVDGIDLRTCRRHNDDPVAGACRVCGAMFCRACLVHPFDSPNALCIECALVTARLYTA